MVQGKGDTWVPLALPADVSDALRSWRTVCEEALGRAAKPSEPIFPVVGRSPAPGLDNSGSMVRLDPRSMTRLVANRAIDAGLDGPRFAAHALRATAATLAYHHGADVLRGHVKSVVIAESTISPEAPAGSWPGASTRPPAGLRKAGRRCREADDLTDVSTGVRMSP
jgi:integrase